MPTVVLIFLLFFVLAVSLGAGVAALFLLRRQGHQEARALQGAPLRHPTVAAASGRGPGGPAPTAGGELPPSWQGGQMHQSSVMWQQQAEWRGSQVPPMQWRQGSHFSAQQWQGNLGGAGPSATGFRSTLQPPSSGAAPGAGDPLRGSWQPTEAQLAREVPPEVLLREAAGRLGSAVGQRLGGNTVITVEMSPVVWTTSTSPSGAAAMASARASAVPLIVAQDSHPAAMPASPRAMAAHTAPPAAGPAGTAAGATRLSLPSSEALERLRATEEALARLEGELAAAAKDLESGTLEPAAGKARLAQIESEAKRLESRGVDDIPTSELNSGRQDAKDAKRHQLKRLEALFSRIEVLFKTLKQ
mmetsp:Transcript_18396/g.37478  ORF Transcript_18396/g.37478 Transcript_18396/m.37478 type:complete len:360 (-) Transcript_18396:110-1189(-)